MYPQITQIHADVSGKGSPVISANLRNLRITPEGLVWC